MVESFLANNDLQYVEFQKLLSKLVSKNDYYLIKKGTKSSTSILSDP